MNENTLREEIISFLSRCGGKSECGMTWREIAERFGMSTSESSLKKLSDWWRYYLDTQKVTPDSCGLKVEVPDGFEIKKVWGKEGNYQVSLAKVNDPIDLKEEQERLIEDIKKFSPFNSLEPVEYKDLGDYMYQISLPDYHWGRTNLFVAAERYKQTVLELLMRVAHNPPEKIVYTISSDFFNSDGIGYGTTKGTPQFDVAEWRTTFRTGWQLVAEVINMMLQVCPVHVVVDPGNHDVQRGFYLGEVISGLFYGVNGVTVDNRIAPFKFVEYGVNMLMFEHGELKAKDYPLIMATEQPEMFARTKYREVQCGHIHKEMVVDSERGIMIRFLPSMADRSEWEKKSGYLSLRAAQGLKRHKTKGLIGIEQVICEEDELQTG